jgi:hypothetical protein
MDLIYKIMAENGGIFTSHLDGSQKHIALGRNRGFDFCLAVEAKFDCIPPINLVCFPRFVFGSMRTFEPRSKRFNIGCVKCIKLARFSLHFGRMDLICKIRAKNGGLSHHIVTALKNTLN